MPNFKDLGVNERFVQTLKENGIAIPTPVQEETIPMLFDGRDVVARARTGTGKTLAFLLPMMQKIDASRPFPQGLIVAPTRELALQITEEARKMAVGTDIRILAVYGGQDVEKQLRKLEGGQHLIIGTPGRMIDHLNRGTLELGGVKMLVLDEADQMLHMGFLDDVETLMQALPFKRQTMLFSATMPAEIKRIAGAYTRSAIDVVIKGENSPVPLKHIRQIIVECSDRSKQEALISMLEMYRPFLGIIFCRTKRRVAALNEALQDMGYNSAELHGDLSQAKREAVMKRFRDAKLQLLVATDVAARGLDVEGVTHVFNYDIPHDVESYIHRIGRTGRAGGNGMALTLATQHDRGELQRIEEEIKHKIERRRYEKDSGISEAVTKSRADINGRKRQDREDEAGGRTRPAGRNAGGEGRARRDDKGRGGFGRSGGRSESADSRGEARAGRGSSRSEGGFSRSNGSGSGRSEGARGGESRRGAGEGRDVSFRGGQAEGGRSRGEGGARSSEARAGRSGGRSEGGFSRSSGSGRSEGKRGGESRRG
ncbi:DEAD/DEAH box helicase, partial [Paenibacillus pini]|uniref:DEAD/DEAH box helicase n=1 Tax=Paenibacillus pini TaxID=669461 RepID=UPI000A4D78C0